MSNHAATQSSKLIQFLLSGEELHAIDDWRFQNRIPSRAEAIRALLKAGLSANPVNPN